MASARSLGTSDDVSSNLEKAGSNRSENRFSFSETDRDALGESPWRDINGYSLLAVVRAEQMKKE